MYIKHFTINVIIVMVIIDSFFIDFNILYIR